MSWVRGAVAGVVLSLVGAAAALDVPAAIRLASVWGDVVFPHARHFETERCATCHGEGRRAGRIEAVHEKMEPAHAFCVGCHRQRTGLTGEPDCSACHLPRAPEDAPLRTETASAR
jgi:c(7)-type cytochrome triheme protein